MIKLYTDNAERLLIPAEVYNVPNPTGITVHTAVSQTALTADDEALLNVATFSPATWEDNDHIRTHLITGLVAGDAGIWVRFTNADEVVIRYSGPAKVIG